MKQTCRIIRIYVTPRGTRGVSYALGGRKGSTLLPAGVDSIKAVRAHLARALDARVLDPLVTVKALPARALGRLAALKGGKTSWQERALGVGRSRVRHMLITQGLIEARVAPGSGQGAPYATTLDTRAGAYSCTCPHATHRGGTRPCKHVAGLARLLLAHPDLDARRGRDRLVRVERVDPGLITRRARVGALVLGCVRLDGARGTSVWVTPDAVVFAPDTSGDGLTGTFGALPGHALGGLVGLPGPRREAMAA